jgi:hypothetical protein
MGIVFNNNSNMSLLTQASLILTPTAEKAGKLYSVVPSNGNGDMDVVRGTVATRVNSLGLIENVPVNEPRLNYEAGSPSILIEPQRTNLALRSEEFNNVIWSKLMGSTITLDSSILNPAGGTSNFIYTASNLAFGGILRQAITALSGQSYTVSFFVKKINYRYVGIRFNTSQTANRCPNYDFDTDTLNKQGVTCDLTRVLFPNGWVRLSLTFISTTTTGTTDIALTTANGDTNVALTGTEKMFVWGAQNELGAYPTSYIPTLGSAQTRNLDSLTRANIFTNNLITSAGGTWFIELNNNILLTRDASGNGIWIGDNNTVSTIGNSFNIRHNGGTSRLGINKAVSGTLTGLYTTLTNTVKIAIDWNGTTADVFVNGVKVVTGTAFTSTNMEFLNSGVGGGCVPKYIKSMMLFPTPLTDSECIALTTL